MNRHVLWQTACEVGPAGTCGTHRTAATTRSDEWGRRKIHRKEAVRRGKAPARPVTKRGGTRPDPSNRLKTIQSRRYRPGLPTRRAVQPSQPSSGGSMRFQDPATARPRPPTVGETRAREKAERKRREIEKARVEAELKRHQRNQRLKGGAAVVGVVGVVAALGYWALSPRTVTRAVRPGGFHGRPDNRARQLLHRPRLAAPAASSSTAATSTATTTAAPEPLAQGRRGAPRSSQRGPPSRRRRAPPSNAAALAAKFLAAAAARGVREARQNTTTAGLVIDRGNTGARLRHARARCGRRGPRVLGRVGVLRVRDGRGARAGGRRRTACIRCA